MPVRRALPLICLLPAAMAGAVAYVSSMSAGQAAVDAVGALIGTAAAVALAGAAAPMPRRRAALVYGGTATALAVLVVTGLWPGSYAPWGAATSWVLIVLAGLVAARARSAAGVTVAVLLAAAAVAATARLAAGGDLDAALLTALPAVVSVALGLVVRAQRRQLAAERVAAAAEQRARIARDLHDTVAHEVTGIVVLAQAAAQIAPPEVAPALIGIDQSGRRALDRIRELVARLRTDPVDHAPVRAVVERFRATTSARVDAAIDDDLDRAPVAQSPAMQAVTAVVTEALTNVRRHGGRVTQVRIDLRRTAGAIAVTVTDDGDGDSASAVGSGGGNGLADLSARITDLGGTLTAGREDDRWRVRATVPENTGRGRR